MILNRREPENEKNYRTAEGTIPAAFKVTESIVGSTGVILMNYERAGAVQTGTYQ